MNISKQNLNFKDIEDNLDEIRKKLYLESPDLWIDFCDKIDEKILDEMVLFYAAKYNFSDIIKFWERAKAGERKSFTYDEIDKSFRINSGKGIMIHYLETIQKDLDRLEQ